MANLDIACTKKQIDMEIVRNMKCFGLKKKKAPGQMELMDRKWGRGPASPQLNKPNARLDPAAVR